MIKNEYKKKSVLKKVEIKQVVFYGQLFILYIVNLALIHTSTLLSTLFAKQLIPYIWYGGSFQENMKAGNEEK